MKAQEAFSPSEAVTPGNPVAAKAQRFFEDLYLETRKSSFGDQARGWTVNLLKRAQEAGLYVPVAQ